jgi:hypothetical protein
MAIDASDHLMFYLFIEKNYQQSIGGFRHWDNLKVGFDEQGVWIKNLDLPQIQSKEIQTIPQKRIFYEKGGRLFPLNSLLPEGVVPSLMWTSIDRAFPVKLPSLNHNFFGVNDTLDIQLIPVENEKHSVAMIADLDILGEYLTYVPDVRLKNLSWCILDDYTACILGTPLLSIQGEVFWQDDAIFLPAGYDIDLGSLREEMKNLLELVNDEFLLWLKSGSLLKLSREDFRPLSRASYRLSLNIVT